VKYQQSAIPYVAVAALTIPIVEGLVCFVVDVSRCVVLFLYSLLVFKDLIMAAKKKTSTGKPVPIATGKAKSASNARSGSQKNKVTSNVPSPMPPKPEIKVFETKNPAVWATNAIAKTILGGASLTGKAIRKATPLPDKPKRAVSTQPSQIKFGGYGNPVVVPVKRNTAQNNRPTSNVTKKTAPKKKK
jgi:hypothetical protein